MSEYRDLFGDWATTVLSVETAMGQTPLGRAYAPARQTEPVSVQDEVKLVRTSGGEEVTSTGVVYAPLDYRTWLTEGSRVARPDGRRSVVAVLRVWETPDMPAYVEARLD